MSSLAVVGVIIGTAGFTVASIVAYIIVPLQTKRMDLLWDYARSLDRSLASQHRMIAMLSAALGIATHEAETDNDDQEDQP